MTERLNKNLRKIIAAASFQGANKQAFTEFLQNLSRCKVLLAGLSLISKLKKERMY